MNGYFRFGVVMSSLVLALIFGLAFGTVKVAGQPDVPRWQAFWSASPNEIGDTIAGVSGTLAFLWIIVTVMIQGSELRLQRRELAMTRRELKAQREASEKMAVAQDAQVKVLEAQAAIFLDEKVQRDESRAKETLDGLLIDLRSFFQNIFSNHCVWKYVPEVYPDGKESLRSSTLFYNTDSRKESIDLPEVDFFRQIFNRINGLITQIDHWERTGTIRSKPDLGTLSAVTESLKSISELSDSLSAGQKHRLSAIGFDDLVKTFHLLSEKTAVKS